MSRTQPDFISPPPAGQTGLVNFAASIQRDFQALFQDAHVHGVRTTAPASNEGKPGDVIPVELSDGTAWLYVKFTTLGWLSVQLS